MTNGYKQQITDRIKDRVNEWIEELKQKHPELLLTRQWRVLWPKGFAEGQNIVPVVTSSKQGKYLVGEVQFMLPGTLDLDLDAVELVLQDAPYKDPARKKSNVPAPIDEPLDLLNDLVMGINGFLQSLDVQVPMTGHRGLFGNPIESSSQSVNPIKIKGANNPAISSRSLAESESIEEVKRQMLRSPYLPDWYESLSNRKVADELLQRLAEGYLHYQKQVGYSVSLEDYFRKYTEYLVKEGKLHHYCRYKGKPVRLDSDDWCTETYCSKKPFHSECPQVTLRFGTPPED